MAVFVLSLAAYLPFAPARLYDFRAFYCAGRAITVHADPYREGPLHACESATSAPGMSRSDVAVTVPAPLPGYSLAIFALLSLVPFGLSALLWIVASLVALIATVRLLREAIGLPVPTIAVATVLPACIVAIPLGQTAPFVGLGIALCAYELSTARWRRAAAGALITSLDPSIALVLCATLLIAVPRTRLTIICGTAALIIASLLTLGLDTNVEYLRTVLHAHATANITERSQFSATHFAWTAGMRGSAALVLGNVWYFVAACAGISIALRARLQLGFAALALVPPAWAVFGGIYVHYSQLVLAIPAFLLALRHASKTSWLGAAIFVLAVPWLALTAFPPFAIALIVLAIVYARNRPRAFSGMFLGIASAALLLAFFAVALEMPRGTTVEFRPNLESNALAESSWSQFIAARDRKPDPLMLLVQLPTILAFSGCLMVLVRTSLRANRAGMSKR